MFSSITMRIFPLLKFTRTLCSGLILNGSKETSKKVALLSTRKSTKKKPKKKHVIVKRVSDDIELVWLENLNHDNLKLFRKTSYGSFKKINLDNLLQKLKEIYPSTLGNVNFSPVEVSPKEGSLQSEFSSATETDTKLKPENLKASAEENRFQSESSSLTEPISESESSENDQASPYLSDYLIRHIMDFPLLKSQSDKSFNDLLKNENEVFGAVDSLMFPSVTGILNETMSNAAKFRLKQWKNRMIAEMGLEEFNKYQKDLLSQGSKFHSTLKTYLEVSDKTLVKVDPQIEGCWKSLDSLLPDISDVRLVEEPIYHPILMYRGIVDCVASFRGTPCVIEWKKSSKPRHMLSETYDAPIQLCAYLGALPWHKNLTVESGLVVVAYTNGVPADVFNMSLEACKVYWMEWLGRLQTYWQKKSSTVLQQEV